MFNYFLLVGLFFAMILACFLPGFIELRWPKDEGPVFVDLDRDVDERFFSRSFSSYMEQGLASSRRVALPKPENTRRWTSNLAATFVRTVINRGPEDIAIVESDTIVPSATNCEQSMILKGNLSTGDSCNLQQEVQVAGDCTIGANNRVLCLAGKNVTIGDRTVIEGWVDAQETLVIGTGCEVDSRATAGLMAIVKTGSRLKSVAAPSIVTIKRNADPASVMDTERVVTDMEMVESFDSPGETIPASEPTAEKLPSEKVESDIEKVGDEAVAAEETDAHPTPAAEVVEEASAQADRGLAPGEVQVVEWSGELDDILIAGFETRTIQELGDEIRLASGQEIPYRAVLVRANEIGLVSKPLTKLNDDQKPEFMRDLRVLLQAPETVRVRGDLAIPEGARIPYDIIVEGDLESGTGVAFDGSLHVNGKAALGEVNQVEGSLIVDSDVTLDEYTVVGQCVDSGGSAFVKEGVRIGASGTGGLAARETIYLEHGVTVHGKVYGEFGIRTVDGIDAIDIGTQKLPN